MRRDPNLADHADRRLRWVGVVLLMPPLLLALFAPALGKLTIGAMLAPPSLRHPLGTDELGHDMLVLLAQGAQVSFAIGTLATLIALLVGTVLGLCAAFGGRLVDDLVMRAAEITVTVPPLLLAIVLVALLGSGTLLTAVALGVGAWPTVGRVARAAGLALRGQPDLLAARALGVSRPGIVLRHVVPAILPVVLALTGVLFSSAVLAEATLSFVGLTNHDAPGWGHIMVGQSTTIASGDNQDSQASAA